MTAYGSSFDLWRRAAGAGWQAYVAHPFVAGLGDGSLPRAAYLRYLQQDYLFLIHFARAWALAVTKAETLSEMRICAATVQALIDDEMRLHVETCAAEGLDEAALAEAAEAPETLAYTRYVLDAGHSGDFLDLMAALAPCVLGYGEIGARLGQGAHAPRYAGWIETYAGGGYQGSCRAVGALIDGAVRDRLGDRPQDSPRWARLCARFETATGLEAAFWDMGLRG